MRYVEVTTKYVVPTDDELFRDPSFDIVVNTGVSMVEATVQRNHPQIIEVSSSWARMPSEYKPRSAGASEVGRVHDSIIYEGDPPAWLDDMHAAGVPPHLRDYPADAPPHPWEQGAFIFPEGHPLAGLERKAKGIYDDPQTSEEEKNTIKSYTRALDTPQKELIDGS